MQNVFGRDGLFADAAFGERQILGDRRIEVMTHLISMSRCSSMVVSVNGRVGLVDDGSTFLQARDFDRCRARARQPAPSVRNAWTVRP